MQIFHLSLNCCDLLQQFKKISMVNIVLHNYFSITCMKYYSCIKGYLCYSLKYWKLPFLRKCVLFFYLNLQFLLVSSSYTLAWTSSILGSDEILLCMPARVASEEESGESGFFLHLAARGHMGSTNLAHKSLEARMISVETRQKDRTPTLT